MEFALISVTVYECKSHDSRDSEERLPLRGPQTPIFCNSRVFLFAIFSPSPSRALRFFPPFRFVSFFPVCASITGRALVALSAKRFMLFANRLAKMIVRSRRSLNGMLSNITTPRDPAARFTNWTALRHGDIRV